jgi:RNA polymerase sigma factor (sigma-70 family)
MADDRAFRTTHMRTLLERLQAGDLEARNDLLNAIAGRLERLARKMLRGFPTVRTQEQTDDVLQRASMRLLRALKDVQPKDTRQFFGLAAEQMRRVLLDLARRIRKLPPAGQDVFSLDKELQAPTEPPEELERWTAFHKAVANLPNEEREVVALIFYHAWKQREVAEVLQISLRTVNRLWQLAQIKLRRKLREEQD